LAAATLLFSSCQHKSAFDPKLSGSFFPLRAGMTWTYQVSFEDGSGATLRLRAQKNTARGTPISVFSSYLPNPRNVTPGSEGETAALAAGLQSEEHYTLEGAFLTRVEEIAEESGSIRFEEARFLPQYFLPHQEWSNTLSPVGFLRIVQHHRTFLERNILIVPAGHFSNCMRIETEATYDGPNNAHGVRYFTDWYAPNVGLVKTLVLGDGPQFWLEARFPVVRALLADTALFRHPVADVELSTFAGSSQADNRGASLSASAASKAATSQQMAP
jgi:hypothetical protein